VLGVFGLGCYQGGQSFGVHVDNAIRQVPGTQ